MMPKYYSNVPFSIGCLGFAALILLLVCLPYSCKADEPLYYLDESDYRFMIPDKIQHFYGSYFLNELTGAPAAALLGVAKECMDAAAGHAFSINDLVADALGIGASILNNKADTTSCPCVVAGLEWRKPQQEIIFFVKMRF